MAVALATLMLLTLAACAAQRVPALPPVSLDPRPRAPHDLPGASIDLLVRPGYPTGAPVDVEIEIRSWGAAIRGPVAAEVRGGAGREEAEVIRRLDVAQVERSIPADGASRSVLAWDGRDSAGQLAPVGMYRIVLVFEIARAGRSASRHEVSTALRIVEP